MRIRLIGFLAILGLSAGCSSPAEIRGAELRTVPETVATDTSVATTTPPSTAAPTTPPATAPTEPTIAAATTIPASSLKSEDELKIEYLITEFRERDWNEQVNRTFDIHIYDGLIEGKQLQNAQRALDKRKASSEYVLPGTIQEAVVVETSIDSDTATAVACQRNDQQVWESNRTTDKADDKLIDGSLAVFRIRYELAKRGATWVITNSSSVDGDCSQSF
jgi:hypothetical protein